MQCWLSFISLFLLYSVNSHHPGMEPSVRCHCYWTRPRSFFLLAIFFFLTLLLSQIHLPFSNIIPLCVLWLWPFQWRPPPPPDTTILKQTDARRIGGGSLRTEDKKSENLVDVRLAPSFFFFFFFSRRAHKLCSAFLRSLISPKEISPGETHSHADGTFPPKPLSLFLSRSIRPFRAPLRSLCLSLSLSFAASLLSYIKQTVSLAALGDIALIFQHSGTGVMQCAAMDTLHEDLSLLKWAKSGRASLSCTGIYLRGTFLISGLYWRNPSRDVFPNAWHAAQIGRLVDLADIMPPRRSIGCSGEELGLVTVPPKIAWLLI